MCEHPEHEFLHEYNIERRLGDIGKLANREIERIQREDLD